tara:strand:+ start:318 stop:1025 length:708 start_codon:yes stop_codon:yes gene_type:complete
MNFLKDYALVIFDCDGVLVDSETIANKILAQSLTQEGYTCTFQEVVTKFVGRDLNSIQRDVERTLGRSLEPSFQTKLQRDTFDLFKQELRPIQGIEKALATIKAPKCVASSGSHKKIHLCLNLTGLSDFFFPKTIFSASEVPEGKPAPDLFLHAAAKMGVSPSNCIVIEDSVPGVAAARAAGMPVFAFAGGPHVDPSHSQNLSRAGGIIFNHMADLPHHLKHVDPVQMRGAVLSS